MFWIYHILFLYLLLPLSLINSLLQLWLIDIFLTFYYCAPLSIILKKISSTFRIKIILFSIISLQIWLFLSWCFYYFYLVYNLFIEVVYNQQLHFFELSAINFPFEAVMHCVRPMIEVLVSGGARTTSTFLFLVQ